jgi:hypothetical protein
VRLDLCLCRITCNASMSCSSINGKEIERVSRAVHARVTRDMGVVNAHGIVN